jgi:hypothetical protein
MVFTSKINYNNFFCGLQKENRLLKAFRIYTSCPSELKQIHGK